MAETTRSAPAPGLAREFDDFLFAPIGEESNGMLLSVASALARLNVDPWQEAASLSRLPGATATGRLATLIAALPDRPSAHLDPGMIAARLITRLPCRVASNTPAREPPADFRTAVQSQFFFFLMLILLVFAMGGFGIVASDRSAARGNRGSAPTSSTPQTSPTADQ